jgi:hypothetical protein
VTFVFSTHRKKDRIRIDQIYSLQTAWMSRMAAASASGRNDARKQLTANSPTEQKDNEINDFSEWCADYQVNIHY